MSGGSGCAGAGGNWRWRLPPNRWCPVAALAAAAVVLAFFAGRTSAGVPSGPSAALGPAESPESPPQAEESARWAFLLYEDERFQPDGLSTQAIDSLYMQWIDAGRESADLDAAEGLGATEFVVTEFVVTDGPTLRRPAGSVEPPGFLTAIFLVRAPTLDAAVELARGTPHLQMGGTVHPFHRTRLSPASSATTAAFRSPGVNSAAPCPRSWVETHTEGHHSALSATAGGTPAALAAGTRRGQRHDREDDDRHPVGRRVEGRDAEKHCRHDPRCGCCAHETDDDSDGGQRETVAQDEAASLRTGGAERHAEPNLSTAQSHRIRQHAVETYGTQKRAAAAANPIMRPANTLVRGNEARLIHDGTWCWKRAYNEDVRVGTTLEWAGSREWGSHGREGDQVGGPGTAATGALGRLR